MLLVVTATVGGTVASLGKGRALVIKIASGGGGISSQGGSTDRNTQESSTRARHPRHIKPTALPSSHPAFLALLGNHHQEANGCWTPCLRLDPRLATVAFV